MDAAEHLPVLLDPPRRALAQFVEHATSGAVNAGQAKHMHRNADFLPEFQPRLLGFDPGLGPRGIRLGRGRLVDPAPLLVAIDADRRQISDPRSDSSWRSRPGNVPTLDRLPFLAGSSVGDASCLAAPWK